MTSPNLPVVEVKDVSKVFTLTTQSVSLRHEATTAIKNFLRQTNDHEEPFYALRDINLSIRQGEAVGIVGHNGAGKTTLLRILSRIMRPSSGRVTLRGSYTSLIGLGAGFIPTMTGRKNIYLNAAIHGLTPKETEARIQDIIAFADIGKHIDSLVKNYSSGMAARLGFSIAVHALPDIVFLDEVLSVGDVAFQKKSQDRLMQLLSQNRTVIFVSHSPEAIRQLCERTIWLHQGRVHMDDQSGVVLGEYVKYMGSQGNQSHL